MCTMTPTKRPTRRTLDTTVMMPNTCAIVLALAESVSPSTKADEFIIPACWYMQITTRHASSTQFKIPAPLPYGQKKQCTAMATTMTCDIKMLCMSGYRGRTKPMKRIAIFRAVTTLSNHQNSFL